MIKRFCDMCDVEMTDKNSPNFGANSSRLAAKLTRPSVELSVEVIVAKDGVSNSGDFCKYCVLDALDKLDDRPGLG